MVSYLLGTEHIDTGLEEFILEKTEGIPFFIEEFIKSLKDLQIIEKEDNAYRIVKDIQAVTIPTTIQDVIMARVDSLPERAKGLLQAGSVVGREFRHDLINKLIEFPEPELLSHLSVLKDSELLYERGIYPQLTYVFKHALTQDVAYNSLLLKRRKELHQEIGTTIEKMYPERLEEFYEMLAHHYTRSDDSDKACQYLKLSGNKATKNYSLWEALRFYKEAINILKGRPTTEENKRQQAEVRFLISTPMFLLGYPEGSLEILKEGEEQLKELGDERNLAFLHSKFALYHAVKGEPLLGIKYTEEPFREAAKSEDIELMVPVGCQLCASYLHAGEHSKLIDAASTILALLEKSKREHDFFGLRYNAYSGLCANSMYSLGMLGRFEEREELYERGIRFAQEAHSVYALSLLELMYGISFNFMGSGADGIDHLQKAIRFAEEAQAYLVFGISWAGLGYGHYLGGNLESAKEFIEKGIKILSEKDLRLFLPLQYLWLSMVHFGSENFQIANDSAENALMSSKELSYKDYDGISRIWLGRILAKADMTTRTGEQHIIKGTKICDEQELKPWSAQGYLFLGELYAGSGENEKALEKLEKAEAMFQEMGMGYWRGKTRGVVERL
jgi:tetratricopeptide (TPR) repeat protein